MGSHPYPITPIGNFIGVVLALLPLISHIRNFSLAVWGYAIWIAIENFQTFVNTIIWHNNVNIVVPVWCDIGENLHCFRVLLTIGCTVTKLQIGGDAGVSACALVICVHVYKITRLRASIETTKDQVCILMHISVLVG